MAINYTPLTDFLTKDTLPKEDPDKVILGADFDAEFNAISTAFAGAAPTNNPTFTGTATFDGVTVNTVTISGVATLGSLDISGNATVGGTLAVNGSITSGGSELTTLDEVTSLIASAELGTVARLSDLSDVEVSSVVDGQSIIWSTADEEWKAGTPALSTLSDVDVTGITNGSFLGWNAGNSEWVPTAVPPSTSVNATASGAITAGHGVVVNSNDTVSQIYNVSRGQTNGTTYQFSTANITITASAYDKTAQKVLVLYHDDAGGGLEKAYLQLAEIGTDKTTITYVGSPVLVNSGYTGLLEVVYDETAQKCVVFYRHNPANEVRAAVVTISGNTASLGTPTSFGSDVTEIAACYDAANGGIAVAIRQDSPTQTGKVRFCTVSGTTVSFGAETVFSSSAVESISICHDSQTESIVIARRQATPSLYTVASAARLVGTAYEFGQLYTISTTSGPTALVYDTALETVYLMHQDSSDHPMITNMDVTTDGVNRGLSVQQTVKVTSMTMVEFSAVYDEDAQKAVLLMRYEQGTTLWMADVAREAESTGLVLGSVYNIVTNSNHNTSSMCSVEADGGVLITYDDQNSDGVARVYLRPYSRGNMSEAFIGFADADYADGEVATVNTSGSVVELPLAVRSGYPLLPGRTCRMDKFGIVANGTPNTGNDERHAGQAASSTSIIVKGEV